MVEHGGQAMIWHKYVASYSAWRDHGYLMKIDMIKAKS